MLFALVIILAATALISVIFLTFHPHHETSDIPQQSFTDKHQALRKSLQSGAAKEDSSTYEGTVNLDSLIQNDKHDSGFILNQELKPEIIAKLLLIDPDFVEWRQKIEHKIFCWYQRNQGGIYYYHNRKTAGTTLREAIQSSLVRSNGVKYYETEGKVLNSTILDEPSLLSIISFREPLTRINSLYWYEHVGWYYGILRKINSCKKLNEWIKNWKDGGSVKQTMALKYYDNNYIEIQEYYTKALLGWTSIDNERRRLNNDDLEKAKAILRKFDLIVISEWLEDDTEADAVSKLLRVPRLELKRFRAKSNWKHKKLYSSQLIPDEVK